MRDVVRPYVSSKSSCQAESSHAKIHPCSGRSVAWLARLDRDQEVASSNLAAPTILSFRPDNRFFFKLPRHLKAWEGCRFA